MDVSRHRSYQRRSFRGSASGWALGSCWALGSLGDRGTRADRMSASGTHLSLVLGAHVSAIAFWRRTSPAAAGPVQLSSGRWGLALNRRVAVRVLGPSRRARADPGPARRASCGSARVTMVIAWFDTSDAPQPATRRRTTRPPASTRRYERCLDSSMNYVVNQHTPSGRSLGSPPEGSADGVSSRPPYPPGTLATGSVRFT